ncbi:MAG: hypothetical protein V3T21_01805 [Candidatus Margulisiibacteriota bacterium]
MASSVKLHPAIKRWYGLHDRTIDPLNPLSSGLPVGRFKGQIKANDRPFADKLYKSLQNHALFKTMTIPISKNTLNKLLKFAPTSLIKSKPGQLEWLIWQRFIRPEDIQSINRRQITESLVNTFATSLHAVISDYISNDYSEKMIERTIKNLIPRPAIEGLSTIFDRDGIQAFFQEKNLLKGLSQEPRAKIFKLSLSRSRAWYFAVHNFRNPKSAINQALRNAAKLLSFDIHAFLKQENLLEGLTPEQKSEASELSLSLSNAWHFSIFNINDPEDAVKRALANAVKLLSFDAQAYLKQENLLEGLTLEQKIKASELSLSLTDVWRFAVNNIKKPEDAVKRALANAVKLLSFDAQAYLKQENLLEGLTPEQKTKVSKLSLSLNDVWNFATHNIKNPKARVKRVLHNVIKLLRFDAQAFLEQKNLLAGLSQKQKSKASNFSLPLNDAWSFAVNYKKPEDALKRALVNAVKLLSFDIQAFLKQENLLEGLTPEQKTKASKLSLSLVEAWHVDAWYFATHNMKKPEDAVKRALRNAIKLICFDAQAYLEKENLLEGLSRKQKSKASKFSPPLDDVWYFAVNNVKGPEDAVKKALHKAINLLSFDIQAFLEKENLLKGLSQKQRKQILKFTPSLTDAWNFTASNLNQPEKGLKKALHNMVKLLSFDTETFLKKENLLKGLSQKQRKEILTLSLSLHYAWRFAVAHMKTPKDAIERALRNVVELLSYDIQAFLKQENLLKGLTEKQKRKASRFCLSLGYAWYFAVRHIANPKDGVKKHFKAKIKKLKS